MHFIHYNTLLWSTESNSLRRKVRAHRISALPMAAFNLGQGSCRYTLYTCICAATIAAEKQRQTASLCPRCHSRGINCPRLVWPRAAIQIELTVVMHRNCGAVDSFDFRSSADRRVWISKGATEKCPASHNYDRARLLCVDGAESATA